jgi:hypothetical protein
MKNLIFIMLFSLFVVNNSDENVKLKPYIAGAETTLNLSESILKLKEVLIAEGFIVEGIYMPTWDKNRAVICVSSKELTNAVLKVGNAKGFAAILKLGLYNNGSKTFISYTSPFYWGNAYFGDDYPKVEAEYKIVHNNLVATMKSAGTYVGKFFGSEKGIEIDDLRDYQYMMGMEKYSDPVLLKKFDSYSAAVAKLDAKLKVGGKNFKLVYDVKIPGKNVKLYGIALIGDKGEKLFMPKIDVGSIKHTAFLPYEILVKENEVFMLHGRYRIAVSFPDLTMSTFSKIMSTPGDIESTLKEVCL